MMMNPDDADLLRQREAAIKDFDRVPSNVRTGGSWTRAAGRFLSSWDAGDVV
ncbi:MAG: hypothetical protein JJE04_24465 [Acidobacteriia bacterium]|nr:hypothetical protein [Terriglobia bacterium]